MATSPLRCPNCDAELQVPDDVWYYTCDSCRESLDLKAQFAYLRGLEAFDEGQALMTEKGPKRPRNKTRYNEIYRHCLDLFVEAYSSLQIAFLGHLVEVQRQVGIEMMASMTGEFLRQNMVSPLEMGYWNMILTEHLAQTEIDRLKVRLGQPVGGLGFLMRLRWTLRLNQLKKKLIEVDQRINRLERQIAFVDVPRARNRRWKP